MDILESYKKAYRELVIQENKKGFIHHLLSYLCFNTIFTFINLLYAKDAIWFFWPILIWGIIGIIPHYLFSIRWMKREIKNMEIIAEARAREELKDA